MRHTDTAVRLQFLPYYLLFLSITSTLWFLIIFKYINILKVKFGFINYAVYNINTTGRTQQE